MAPGHECETNVTFSGLVVLSLPRQASGSVDYYCRQVEELSVCSNLPDWVDLQRGKRQRLFQTLQTFQKYNRKKRGRLDDAYNCRIKGPAMYLPRYGLSTA